MASPDSQGRLIIVSNRLPVSVNRNKNGTYDFTPSSGGLVSGLSGLSKGGVEYQWYGWPGLEVPQAEVSNVEQALLHKHGAVPVHLDQHTAEQYYDGFSSTDNICLSWVMMSKTNVRRRHHDLAAVSRPN